MRTLVRRKAVRMEAQKSRGFYLCKEQKGKAMGNLDIKEQKKKWIYLKEWNCYKLEQVCYCEKPRVQKEQSMNIFVPAEYLDGQGNVLHEDNKKMCEYVTGVKVAACVQDGDKDLRISAGDLKALYEEERK